jgi:uncharacterized RmlC-like cupin family protein
VSAAAPGGLRLIRSGELSGATAQTSGMIRSAAISGDLTGAQALWMGRTELPTRRGPSSFASTARHGD